MGRRPTSSQLASQVDDLVKVLMVAQQVFPVYAEQARLELQELTGRLPTSDGGLDCSDEAPPWYSDPTGETVVNFRPARDGNCDPTQDLERIAAWVGDVQHLIGSTRRMLNNCPAVTLSVVADRKPTDGRTAEEHAQRRFVRVLSGEPCLIGQDHEDTDRFGPGVLRRGMCDRHRKAYQRWLDVNSADLFGVDDPARLVRWQMAVFGCVARGAKPGTAETGPGPYKANLKEVA